MQKRIQAVKQMMDGLVSGEFPGNRNAERWFAGDWLAHVKQWREEHAWCSQFDEEAVFLKQWKYQHHRSLEMLKGERQFKYREHNLSSCDGLKSVLEVLIKYVAEADKEKS